MEKFIQTYFTFFIWCLNIPYAELPSAISVCNSASFLSAYQSDCSKKPTYHYVLGIMGVILNVLVSNTIIMYFVSYDFLDPNVLKRRYRFNLIFVIICRAIEIYLYYLNLGMVIYIKYFMSHLIGFIFIYDWLKYLPFKDKGINLMYGCSIFIYESIMIIYSLWEIWPD